MTDNTIIMLGLIVLVLAAVYLAWTHGTTRLRSSDERLENAQLLSERSLLNGGFEQRVVRLKRTRLKRVIDCASSGSDSEVVQ